MKEYRKVVQFKYKNNTYNMYLDNNNKHFFLKCDEKGNLYYVTNDELIELTRLFYRPFNIMDFEGDSLKSKVKFVPKIINGGLAVVLTASLLSSCVNAHDESKKDDFTSNPAALIDDSTINDTNSINEFVSTNENNEANNDYDTYHYSNSFNIMYVYDMDYLHLVYENENITIDDLYTAINSNNQIPNKFKSLLYKYCDSVCSKYPTANLKPFYENLKELNIVEVSDDELANISSPVSLGCYDRDINTIYMKDYYTYDCDWQYQVLFHELSHCFRTRIFSNGDQKIFIQAEGDKFSNYISVEALNSLFAVSLFDYEEDNISYQLQSNYFNVMIDCMDNYDLSDYANHSISYFADKLDEYNNDANYATVILELMQVQYNEYHGMTNSKDTEKTDTYFSVDQEQYYPIYDYISKMYYNKYINENMSYDEMKMVADELVSKISINVPEKYNIDYDRFYDNLNTYQNIESDYNKTL